MSAKTTSRAPARGSLTDVPASDDALALAGAIADGVLTPEDALRRARARAEAVRDLGAICWISDSAAPDAGDGGAAKGPFGGVPLLVKDLGGPFAGIPMRAGSAALAGKKGVSDSDLAARFRAAGFVAFGATTVPEFGLSLSSEPRGGPRCRNPLDPARIAGGSSGGAAAAVAAGVVPLAHATDAGGSIRVPAAACGLIGLKPSRGAIPGGPSFGNHLGGIATEFAVTRSIRDALALWPCLAGQARGPFPNLAVQTTAQAPMAPLRIGLIRDADGITPARGAAVEAAARALEGAGHVLTTIPAAALARIRRISARGFDRIVSVNIAALGDSGLDLGLCEPLTQAFAERGRALSAPDLWQALEAGASAAHQLWALFDQVDVLVLPMLSGAPPALGAFPTDHRDPALQLQRMEAFAPFAALANITGAPALTLPFGADDDGLPLPVQLIAPMGGDLRLLALGATLEAEGRWQHPIPLFGGPHDPGA